jgi:hypothetical protein
MRHSQPPTGGTPIEQAPLWVLVIFAAILWLVTFPALVGLLWGSGAWRGSKVPIALAALGVAVLVVVGLATRKPWRRPAATDLRDERPLFARFSTWLWTTILFPNVLFGVLVLTHEGQELSYEGALVIGAIISAVQAALAALERWKRRRRGLPDEPTE